MKKLLVFGLLVLLVMVVYYGCSKDHKKLVFDPTQGLASPTKIDTVIFNQNLKSVTLVWIQEDTANVVGYHIYMADTSAIIDASFVQDWLTATTDTTFVLQYSYTDPEKQQQDTTWYYFGVAAVNENGFTGPLSDVDSVDVVK